MAKQETAVIKYNESASSLTQLRQGLVAQKKSFAEVLPNWMEADAVINRIVRVAQNEPKVLDCTLKSIVLAARFCSEIGMEPNTPEAHVYLIPYGKELQPVMGYRGMITLAHRSKGLKDIQTGTVYKGDTFRIVQGTNPTIEHERNYNEPRNVDDIVCSYAVFRLMNGGVQVRVVDKAEVQTLIDAAKKSQRKVNPWRDNISAMMEKTAIRRGMKLVPLESSSFAYNAINRAIQVDELIESGQSISEAIDVEIIDLDNQDDRILNSVKNAVSDNTTPCSLSPERVGIENAFLDAYKAKFGTKGVYTEFTGRLLKDMSEDEIRTFTAELQKES